jgi:hypothetical protein
VNFYNWSRNKESTFNIKITKKLPSQARNCILYGQVHVKARISLQVMCMCSLCRHHHDLRKTLTAINHENEIIAVGMKGRNTYTKMSPFTSHIHDHFSAIRCTYDISPSQSGRFRNHENSCAKNAHIIEM